MCFQVWDEIQCEYDINNKQYIDSQLHDIISIKNSMKQKLRKSCQPTSIPANLSSARMRDKFLTGVKKSQPKPTSLYPSTLPQPIPSDSIISQSQDFTPEQLTKAFYFLSDGKQVLGPQNLRQFLLDENQEQFQKYQMIRLLGGDKGYVEMEEWMGFFIGDQVKKEGDVDLGEMGKRRQWKQTVQEEFQLLQGLHDQEYCEYLKKQLDRLRDVNVNLNINGNSNGNDNTKIYGKNQCVKNKE